MKDGICPKCEAKEIHFYEQSAVETAIYLGYFRSASSDYYICTNCGYVELFVRNREDLPKISEKYPKV